MNAHVLMNLLTELGKRDEMRGLPKILFLFYHKFNKFNNTGARKLKTICHMTLKLLNNHFCGMKNQDFSIFYSTL